MKITQIFLLLAFMFIAKQSIAQVDEQPKAENDSLAIDALTILPNGNVGVGTSKPTQKLEIDGNIKVKGDINTQGSVLIGDGTAQKPLDISKNGGIRINRTEKASSDNEILFADNGQIRSLDDNHRIIFDRKNNTMEMREHGNIVFSPGAITGDRTQKVTFKANGNVGIGTQAPFEKLHIQDGNITIRSNTSLYGSMKFGTSNLTYKDYWAGISSYNTGGLDQADLRFYTAYGTQKGERMRINQHGNVGIGTVNPTQAKLVVEGVGGTVKIAYAFLKGLGQRGFQLEKIEQYSIYASNYIAAQEFHAFSDARIKNVLGISNTTEDLETLSKIEITDYSMIDTISKGNQTHKKVIAQQVKEVYPQAVSSDLTDVIPNIYALSAIKDGWIQTNTKDLVVGDKIQLIFSEDEILVDVLEIQGGAIKVASDQEGPVFVYGKQVSNFHTVDYEAIAMLNVSATQELLKRIDTLSRKQKQLEDHLSSSVSRIEKLEALFNSLK